MLFGSILLLARGLPYLETCFSFSNGPWGQTATLPMAPHTQIRETHGLTLLDTVSEWVPGIAWPLIMVRKPHWGHCQHCAYVHFAYSETIGQHLWKSRSHSLMFLRTEYSHVLHAESTWRTDVVFVWGHVGVLCHLLVVEICCFGRVNNIE